MAGGRRPAREAAGEWLGDPWWSLLKKNGTPQPQGMDCPLGWIECRAANVPRIDAASTPMACRGLDGLDRLGCCRLRRRTYTQREPRHLQRHSKTESHVFALLAAPSRCMGRMVSSGGAPASACISDHQRARRHFLQVVPDIS